VAVLWQQAGEEAHSLQAGGDPKRDDEVDVDFEVATPTRFGAWTETGEAQFEIDRDVTARLYASHPGGIDAFRTVGTAAQAFVERAVRYVIDEAGVRQFLVIGSSVSGRANVHEVAQAIAPDARVVYVLFDPLMLVYAHRLLNGANEGTTAYVQARLRDVDEILNRSAATLDFAQPVAVLMPGSLGFVRKAERAAAIVDGFMAALAPGSHLVLSHHASDLLVEHSGPVYKVIADLAAEGRGWDLAPRDADEIAAFFKGMEIVEPGVVPVEEWRPDDGDQRQVTVALYGAVGRKP
jgi:hypothetical protein